MKHQTFETHPDLSPFIKCYWSLEIPAEKTPKSNTIVPDGRIKMIFHYGDTYKHHQDNGETILLPNCFVIGQLTKPYEVEPTGKTGTFMVCFHPSGFEPFTSTSIKEMENTAISLTTLFGLKGKKIGNQILKAQTDEERIEFIEIFLFKILRDKKTSDYILKSTIETIITANGKLSIDEISQKTQVNRRQIERKFSSNVGLSPKQLSKITRLQSTLKVLLDHDDTSLTQLAYKSQYYDQAHFNKDFKEFTGLTPKEFYGDNLKMSLIFDTPE